MLINISINIEDNRVTISVQYLANNYALGYGLTDTLLSKKQNDNREDKT